MNLSPILFKTVGHDMKKNYKDMTLEELGSYVKELRIRETLNEKKRKDLNFTGGIFTYDAGVVKINDLDPYMNDDLETYEIVLADIIFFEATRHETAVYDEVYDDNYNEIPAGYDFDYQFDLYLPDGYRIGYVIKDKILAEKILAKLSEFKIKGAKSVKKHL